MKNFIPAYLDLVLCRNAEAKLSTTRSSVCVLYSNLLLYLITLNITHSLRSFVCLFVCIGAVFNTYKNTFSTSQCLTMRWVWNQIKYWRQKDNDNNADECFHSYVCACVYLCKSTNTCTHMHNTCVSLWLCSLRCLYVVAP